MSEPSLFFPYVPFLEDLPEFPVPSCAAWFSPSGVSQVEQESFQDFFSGDYPSKTPKVYMTYRNFIVNLFRENPQTYLKASDCRYKLTGDSCAIIRIHNFLEYWGLINYKLEKPLADKSSRAPPGHLNYNQKRLFELGRPYCGFCGVVVGVTWYHSEFLLLCKSCFEAGNYPQELHPKNFSRQDLLSHFNYSQLEKAQNWSQESLDNLLKALLKYKENWNEVAREVNKKESECIAKYLETPVQTLTEFEENYLKAEEFPLEQESYASEKIDISNAMQRAQEVKLQEDKHINSILDQLIALQLKKLEKKSKYFEDMEFILSLETNSYRLKLQQALTEQAALLLPE